MIGIQTLPNFEGLGELGDSHISCAPGPCSSTVSFSSDLFLYDWHTSVTQFGTPRGVRDSHISFAPRVLVPQQFLILAFYIYVIGIQALPNFERLGECAIVSYRLPLGSLFLNSFLFLRSIFM